MILIPLGLDTIGLGRIFHFSFSHIYVIIPPLLIKKFLNTFIIIYMIYYIVIIHLIYFLKITNVIHELATIFITTKFDNKNKNPLLLVLANDHYL